MNDTPAIRQFIFGCEVGLVRYEITAGSTCIFFAADFQNDLGLFAISLCQNGASAQTVDGSKAVFAGLGMHMGMAQCVCDQFFQFFPAGILLRPDLLSVFIIEINRRHDIIADVFTVLIVCLRPVA